MNTGITRIVIVAALAVAGFAVLVSGFSGAGSISAGGPGGETAVSPSVSVSVSKSPKTSLSPHRAKKIDFFVLNGTTAVGVAGAEEQRLSAQGLTPALNAAGFAADDAPSKPVTKTVVYFRGGAAAAQNRADAQWVADTFYKGAPVRELAPIYATGTLVPAAANVVIVIGNDRASGTSG
ncbi:MAG: LytR C-terminal domain-containing protein [Actinobacteria bacterium]|nr:LytR C-terminal domain-containing protein [Actinomycetota bacterium]